MAVFKTGNMWDAWDTVDHFIITTNSTLKNNGALVMGAGIARQVRDRFSNIDRKIGTVIKQHPTPRRYGLLLGAKKLGIFQVKYHWGSPADLELIRYSTSLLTAEAISNPDKTYALNFPGIGNGKLHITEVAPIMESLPDNVEVWSFS